MESVKKGMIIIYEMERQEYSSREFPTGIRDATEEMRRNRVDDSRIEDVAESEEELKGWEEHKGLVMTAQISSAGG